MIDPILSFKKSFYDSHGIIISCFQKEKESQEYGACRYEINGKKIISRNAKITPKKVGQFVTVWKRSSEGITQPFEESDNFNLLVINVRNEDQLGQFVFPKSILIEKGIITSNKKEGKRGFRVYPPWDEPTNSQATRSQKWQIGYFITSEDSYEAVMNCYQQI
ncbi:MAG: MepB family protein [Reichenbachiella sp.]|uniref:MepB family protein n=1 Tax=Reichenbachiella sp. TaxID=2184521 RepID=UPI002965F0FB|nr:MepB family protein [Reichenbachiella sp.]MDW3208614.1 MepB family protein [Reichenbachiella sp.]